MAYVMDARLAGMAWSGDGVAAGQNIQPPEATMKRTLLGALLALALLVTAGSAGATVSMTSCGMAYIPPTLAYQSYGDNWGNLALYVANITDETVHVKITLYYTSGTVERVWETDIAPHAIYYNYYDGADHPASPTPTYYGTIEWTAQFCTQKALVATAVAIRQHGPATQLTRDSFTLPVNGGLPF